MNDEELASHLAGSLTSLRHDGHPVTLPMWFVVLDGHVHVRTRSDQAPLTWDNHKLMEPR